MTTKAIQQNFSINKRSLAYFIVGAALLLAAWILLTQRLLAAAPPDPYADSVSSTSGNQEVNNPNNAVGAPDGQTTGLAGVNSSITLDMGPGEEGTKNLTAYFGPVSGTVSVKLEFLNSSGVVIATRSTTLPASVDTTNRVFNFDQSTDGGTYRFVRITSTVSAGLSIDAIQASDYIGSGTGSSGSGGGTGAAGGTGSSGTSGGSGGTGAAATPGEATSTDQDGDGKPDAWEIQYGLNPNDSSDASKDADNDCLTNLAEYRQGTDPNVANDLNELGLTVSCDGDGSGDGEDWWLWLLFILLLTGAVVSFWKSIKHTNVRGGGKRRR